MKPAAKTKYAVKLLNNKTHQMKFLKTIGVLMIIGLLTSGIISLAKSYGAYQAHRNVAEPITNLVVIGASVCLVVIVYKGIQVILRS